MTKEDIERKCLEYSQAATPSYTNGTFDRYAIAQAFEDGAEWRINSVWHTFEQIEEADLKSSDLVIAIYPHGIYKMGHFAMYEHYKSIPETNVQERVSEPVIKGKNHMVCLLSKCIGWAYVKDLIPINEEQL